MERAHGVGTWSGHMDMDMEWAHGHGAPHTASGAAPWWGAHARWMHARVRAAARQPWAALLILLTVRRGACAVQLMRERLTSLELSGTVGFDDVGIKALAAYCPQIRTLRVVGCAVSGTALGVVAQHCRHLQLVQVSEYFRAALQGAWSEAESQAVTLTSHDPEDVKLMLSFLDFETFLTWPAIPTPIPLATIV